MSVTRGSNRPGISGLFVLGWTLSLTLPVLLLPFAELATAQLAHVAVAFAFAIPFIFWAIIGVLQFQLLKRTPLRPRLWLAATIVGGSLGQIANGLVLLLLQTRFDFVAIGSAADMAWLTSSIPYLPLVIAELLNIAMLALAQSICFVDTLRERGPWVLASLLASIIGSIAGIVASISFSRRLATAEYLDFISTPVMFGVVYPLIINVVGYTVLGLLTGLCLRMLLARRLRLQHAGLIGQFD